MTNKYAGLNDEFADVSDVMLRDTFTLYLVGHRHASELAERNKLLDEQIAAGWGTTEQRNIPENWREVRGPDTEGRRNLYRARAKNNGKGWNPKQKGIVTS